jgi:glycerol-3-phosphate dehydrogenase
VVPKLYTGEQAYLLQNDDGRIAFVIPFEDEFSLVGTTEVPLAAPEAAPQIDAAEAAYLCELVGRFFQAPLVPSQAVWSYAGIRALYDDGQGNVSSVSREYRLTVDGGVQEAPLLSVFGGKLTTYRYLAERVLDKLRPWLPGLRPSWSAQVHLPGGGLGPSGLPGLLLELARRYPKLSPELLLVLARRHGTLAARVLGTAQIEAELGEHFGAGLYAAEVDYMIAHEWALEADDILWRRTKCGLRIDAAGQARLRRHVTECLDRTKQAP